MLGYREEMLRFLLAFAHQYISFRYCNMLDYLEEKLRPTFISIIFFSSSVRGYRNTEDHGGGMFDAFKKYRERGWVVHSLNIKTVLDKHGVEKKSPEGWKWQKPPSCFKEGVNSLSINTEKSKLIVIDIDAPALAEWENIERLAGGPFDTFTVRSGSGGLHVYFNAFDDPDFNKSWSKCFTGADGAVLDIDLRGRGGVIFASPSSYTTLAGYVRRYDVLRDTPVTDMPDRLRQVLGERMNRRPNPKKRTKATRSEHGGKKSRPAATFEKKSMDEDLRLEVTKYIRGMLSKRAEPFDTWQPILYACANIACAYEFDESVNADKKGIECYMLSLAHTFSKKGGPEYDPRGVESFFHDQMKRFKAEPSRKHYGIPTLKDAYRDDGS